MIQRRRVVTTDRDPVSVHSLFKRAKKIESSYRSQLRKIARHIGDIAQAHDAETPDGLARIQAGMLAYAERLTPWAESVGDRMVKEIAAADRESWRKTSALIGRLLHKEIETAPTGMVLRSALAQQVDLITSLPRDAAARVHKLTLEGMAEGRRTSEIVKDIMASGEVARSRAECIAVTEVSRTASELTRVRCEHIGVTQYKWHTVHDASVRRDHRALDGKVFSWADPPIIDQRTGARGAPGTIYRCRCWAEPILSEAD